MVLVPNFNVERSILGFQKGRQFSIDQETAAAEAATAAAQEARTAQLFPGVLRQQEQVTQSGELQAIATNKVSESRELVQALQRIEQIQDPVQRAEARKQLNPLATSVFGNVLQGQLAFDDSDSDEDSALVINQILGPNPNPIVSDAEGRQFRANRLSGQLEQVPVNRLTSQAQPPAAPAPIPTTAAPIPTAAGAAPSRPAVPTQPQAPTAAITPGPRAAPTAAADPGAIPTAEQLNAIAPASGPGEPKPDINRIITPEMILRKQKADDLQRKGEIADAKERRAVAKDQRDITKAKQERTDAEIKKDEKREAQVNAFIIGDEKLNNSIEIVERMLKNDNGIIQAVGPIEGRSWIPTVFEDAVNLETDLALLQVRLGFQELIKLKASGATFGALSEKEFENISTSVANLTLIQDEKTFRRTLSDILSSIKRFRNRARAIHIKRFGQLPTNNERGIGVEIGTASQTTASIGTTAEQTIDADNLARLNQ